MSWSEWMGEAFDPGPMGGVRFEGRRRGPRKRWVVLLLGLAALIALAGWLVFATRQLEWPPLGVALVTFAYLVLAYYVRPEPDPSNVGWFGGLMDNPLRWSDDVNRMLIWLHLLLTPGLCVSAPIVALARLGRRAWSASDAEWNAPERGSDEGGR